jgi:FAD synthetase
VEFRNLFNYRLFLEFMKKVLVFGSFDLLHEGHKYFLGEAKKLGDKLTVVVARDETIMDIKNVDPMYLEKERIEHVKKLDIADEVILGYKGDKWKVIETVNPEIIALGYDQDSYTKGLEKGMKERGLKVRIIRLGSYKPEKYKSSLLKKG